MRDGPRALLAAAWERGLLCGRRSGLGSVHSPQVAQQIRDKRRADALRRLLGSQEAVAEADAAHETCLRRRGRGAEEAADTAGHLPLHSSSVNAWANCMLSASARPGHLPPRARCQWMRRNGFRQCRSKVARRQPLQKWGEE
ncbi:hypothetical protein ACWCQS_06810 [Streptomyces sp. NPDC002076]